MPLSVPWLHPGQAGQLGRDRNNSRRRKLAALGPPTRSPLSMAASMLTIATATTTSVTMEHSITPTMRSSGWCKPSPHSYSPPFARIVRRWQRNRHKERISLARC